MELLKLKLLKEPFLASISYSCQEFSAKPNKTNPVAGKEIQMRILNWYKQ
jgi:hypothetical protein